MTSTVERPETAEHAAGFAGRLVRRYVNDTIYAVAIEQGGDDVTVREFMCECGRLDCDQLVMLPLGVYDESCRAGSITAHAA
jgi:hypothetical protein